MNSEPFPHWCCTPADRDELEYWCSQALADWRNVYRRHRGAKDLGVRLELRRPLAAAYDALVVAYNNHCKMCFHAEIAG